MKALSMGINRHDRVQARDMAMGTGKYPAAGHSLYSQTKANELCQSHQIHSLMVLPSWYNMQYKTT